MTQGRYQFRPPLPFVPGIEAVGESVAVGATPAHIEQMERIQRAARLGTFLGMMQLWEIPHEKTMKAIQRFGKHVLPHFKCSTR